MYFSLIIYSIVSFLIITICAIVSYKLNLLDIPEKRKIHTKPTAYTGGLAISISYFVLIKILNINNYDLNLLIFFAFLMTLIGLMDDKYNLNASTKICLQIIPIIYLVVIKEMNLVHIGDYEFFKINLGIFSIPFTILCVLLLINSFNYFDGIDGALSFTSISTLIFLYILTFEQTYKIFLVGILLPLFIFLFFNFAKFKLPKLFLGDSGSLLLGFLVSFMLINLANQKIIHPILLAWTVALFVYEFLSLNLQRVIFKKNIFKPGFDHLHHLLLKKNQSILITNLLLVITNIIFFISGYVVFYFLNPIASLILFVFLFAIYFFVRSKFLFKS